MKITTIEVAGLVPALRGMRNPLNSWDKSDSNFIEFEVYEDCEYPIGMVDGHELNHTVQIGENDLKLAQRLIVGGGEHRKFLRQIQVWANFDMPRYYWSEHDTYHFNNKNSCSTMHRLLNTDEEITKDLFVTCEEDVDLMDLIIARLEMLRKEFRSTKDIKQQLRLLVRAKRILPEGFLQLRTVNTNYEELRNMYLQRHNHRLKEEWVDTFCRWVETLPYAKELILYGIFI